MLVRELTALQVRKGSALPGDIKPVLDEASRAIAQLDNDIRARVQANMEKALNGTCGAIIFTICGLPAGLVSYDEADDDAQLLFGYVLQAHRDKSAEVLEMAVRILEKQFRTIRSNFNWPEPDAFSDAARAMGFSVVERLCMSVEADPGHKIRMLPGGLEIGPFSQQYFDEVARLMCNTSDPMDRVVYPFFSSVDGCRTHLGNYLNSVYGSFKPELTYVARQGDRLAGYLISVSFTEGIAHILDIAVDDAFRGKGLASAMIDSLVQDSGTAGYKTIELAVTSSNLDALRLYRHKGFVISETVRQHVYVSKAENDL
jgi:ribosomal protein S18 acetylase RimI-like enzyme